MGAKLKIKLNEKHIKTLANLPEQGLGYQIVDIKLKNGKILKNKLVFNSSYLQIDKTELLEADDIDSINLHSH